MLTWIDGLLIFIAILLGYLFTVLILHKKGILEKYNISLFGPALLLKTKKGLGFLKRISKRKRFWKSYGNFAIILCFILMILVIYLFIWNVATMIDLDLTPTQKENLPGPEYALLLPVINPIIPLEYLFYVIVALVVAIIVHEFSHGILTFAGDLKVKSMGIMYLIIPIGAFVEPDEEQLKKTDIKKRLRVFAVGPMANFVVVLIALLLFSFVFLGAAQPVADGVVIISTSEDSPAYEYGFEPGMIITSINNSTITSYNDFFVVMNNTRSGEEIEVEYYWNGFNTKFVNLSDKYEEYEKRNPQYNNESFMGKGYFGIYPGSHDIFLSVLKNPFGYNIKDRFIYVMTLPVMGALEGYNPITYPFTESYEITGPLNVIPSSIYWGIVNIIYWIFWLNLMVGLFNVVPMIPLDGGYLFNDYVKLAIKKLKKGISQEKLDKIVGNISLVVSLTVLFLIIFPFIFKYI